MFLVLKNFHGLWKDEGLAFSPIAMCCLVCELNFLLFLFDFMNKFIGWEMLFWQKTFGAYIIDFVD